MAQTKRSSRSLLNQKTGVMSLGKNGLESFQKGLPERRLLEFTKKWTTKIICTTKRTRDLYLDLLWD